MKILLILVIIALVLTTALGLLAKKLFSVFVNDDENFYAEDIATIAQEMEQEQKKRAEKN